MFHLHKLCLITVLTHTNIKEKTSEVIIILASSRASALFFFFFDIDITIKVQLILQQTITNIYNQINMGNNLD